jgi:predicted nucleotidyltransferase
MMRYGLSDNVIDQINKVLSRYPQIKKAVLYGSRAKGNYKHGSDIDLALFGAGLNLFIVNKLNNDIDDLLLPYTFDFCIFSEIANPDLIDHINRVGILFYKRAEQR